MTDSHIFSGPSCGQLCAVTATTLASVLLLGWNGKRWRERSCCWPHTRHTKNPPSRFGLLFFSIITSHGKSRWVLCLERRFCWESVTWSSPKLPPSLTVGQVGQKRRASSRLPVRRAGQHRLRRHLPPPLRTTCRRRGRCSPRVSTRWHFKYFNPPHPGYGGEYEAECQNLTSVSFMV